MEVLQVFESDGSLYVYKEYPQRNSGQTDASLWKKTKNKTQQEKML